MTAQMIGSLDVAATGVALLHDVQLDYYGQRACAASEDHTINVWDVAEGQQRLTGQLKGHEGPVWKVTWAHPKFGPIIASCGFDMKVIVWKEVQGTWHIAYMDTSHTASVNDVEFCPWEHGLRLACASSDGTVSVLTYRADNAQWLRTAFPANAGGTQSLSWSPVTYRDGVPGPAMRLVTGGCDNSIRVMRCENEQWTAEATQVPVGHTDWVRDVAWRPDASSSYIASGSWDKTVVVCAQEVEGRAWHQVCRLELPGKVERLSWSVTGSILAVAYGDNEIVLYKESYNGNGRFEEVGKVAENGFIEVPSSISAAAAFSAIGSGQPTEEKAASPPAPPQPSEQELQQQAVLSSFGMT